MDKYALYLDGKMLAECEPMTITKPEWPFEKESKDWSVNADQIVTIQDGKQTIEAQAEYYMRRKTRLYFRWKGHKLRVELGNYDLIPAMPKVSTVIKIKFSI
jgi:Cft2 family RNA processing exonuclease